MRIENGTIVSLNYQVTDLDGNVVDDGEQPMLYLHGAEDQLFPKLQAALDGKAVGESIKVELEPDDAFGEYDADLVVLEALSVFPPDIAVGVQVQGGAEGEEPMLYTVTDIEDDTVVLDGNHPLAGITLVFACTVAAVRTANAEEIADGQIHS